MWRVFFAAVLICAGCARESAQEQFDLGVKYQNGDGVSKDSVKALEWYIKAAERGNAPAQFNLAVMYQRFDRRYSLSGPKRKARRRRSQGRGAQRQGMVLRN